MILKRGDTYHLRIYHRGKQVWKTLETGTLEVAKRRAKLVAEAVRGDKWSEVSRVLGHTQVQHTVGDLIEAYMDLPLAASEKTRRANVRAFRQLWPLEAREPITRLQSPPDLRKAFLGAKECLGGASLRTYNSLLRQAKSLFSKDAVAGYQRRGMAVSPSAFLAIPPAKVETPRYVPPSREVLQRLSDGLEQLERERSPIAAVLILAGFAGLRAGEIYHAKWSWVGEQGITVGDEDYTPKSGKRRFVPILADVRQRLVNLQTGLDYVVDGENREDLVFRQPQAWLKSVGITDRKPLHSLRKLFGCLVESTQGIRAASAALGHSSVAITERHYLSTAGVAPVSALSLPQA